MSRAIMLSIALATLTSLRSRQPVTEPIITSIAPAVLRPGDRATISGSGFLATQAGVTVTVDGVAVRITRQSDQLLSVQLPSIGFACTNTRRVSVRVVVDGVVARAEHDFNPARDAALNVGEVLRSEPGHSSNCISLAGDSARYVIAVANTAPIPAAEIGFVIRGSTGVPLPVIASNPVVRTDSAVAAIRALESDQPLAQRAETVGRVTLQDRTRARIAESSSTTIIQGVDSTTRSADAHAAILAGNDSLARNAGRPEFPAYLKLENARVGDLRERLKVGSRFDVRVRTSPDNCDSYDTVTARVVFIGEHSIVLEDVKAAVAGKMDSVYRGMGREFESVMWPLLTNNFGSPLAFDSNLDSDGRMRMLFSPGVGKIGNVVGYVSSCDFYPRTTYPASNMDEMFYAITPDSMGAIDAWRRENRATLIHEAKHLVSYAYRFKAASVRQASVGRKDAVVLEEPWLEEGSAMISEELYARKFSGLGWKQQGTFQTAIACDFSGHVGACADRPQGVSFHFAFLYAYLVDNERLGLLGPVNGKDASYYGSSWYFLRWALDQFAWSEPQSLRALTQEPAKTGVDNFEQQFGKTFSEVLPQWFLGMALANHRELATPPNTMQTPSWDLGDVMRGLHAADSARYWREFPLMERAADPADEVNVPSLRGGSGTALLLENAKGRVLLALQSPTGSAPSPFLHMLLIRVH